MDCKRCNATIKQWLLDALEHGGSPVIPPEVDEHAQTCSACRVRLQAARGLLREPEATVDPPADLSARISARIRQEHPRISQPIPAGRRFRGSRSPRIVVAAAAVLVATLGLGVLLGRGIAGPSGGPPAATAEQIVRIEFQLEAPEAEVVAVVGDWNDWSPEANQLTDDDGDGVWTTTVRLSPGRDYQYQFLIDGRRWVADPESRLHVDDGFGGTNSVLSI